MALPLLEPSVRKFQHPSWVHDLSAELAYTLVRVHDVCVQSAFLCQHTACQSILRMDKTRWGRGFQYYTYRTHTTIKDLLLTVLQLQQSIHHQCLKNLIVCQLLGRRWTRVDMWITSIQYCSHGLNLLLTGVNLVQDGTVESSLQSKVNGLRKLCNVQSQGSKCTLYYSTKNWFGLILGLHTILYIVYFKHINFWQDLNGIKKGRKAYRNIVKLGTYTSIESWRQCPSLSPSLKHVRPCLLVSVQSRAGLRLSKNVRVGLDVSDSLAVWNAQSWSVVHMNSFLVLKRGRSGANRLGYSIGTC